MCGQRKIGWKWLPPVDFCMLLAQSQYFRCSSTNTDTFLFHRKCFLSLNSETYLTPHKIMIWQRFTFPTRNFTLCFQRSPLQDQKHLSSIWRVCLIRFSGTNLQIFPSKALRSLCPGVAISSSLKTCRRKSDDSDITGIKTNILQKKAHCSPNPITLSVTLQDI